MRHLLSLGSILVVVLVAFAYGFARLPWLGEEIDSYIASILSTAGRMAYARGDYDGADRLYARAEALSTASGALATIAYDRGNIAYREVNHTGALAQYHTALSGTGEVVYRAEHATGNSLYRIGEYSSSGEGIWQVIFWTEAVKAYERALAVHDDPETRANRDFVLEKLKQLQKSQKHDTPQSGSWQSGSGSASGSGSNGKSDSTSTAGKWTNTGTYQPMGNGDGKDESGKNLSESEQRALEEYSQDMGRFERENGRYFHRDGKSPSAQSLFDDFFGTDKGSFSDEPPTRERDW